MGTGTYKKEFGAYVGGNRFPGNNILEINRTFFCKMFFAAEQFIKK